MSLGVVLLLWCILGIPGAFYSMGKMHGYFVRKFPELDHKGDWVYFFIGVWAGPLSFINGPLCAEGAPFRNPFKPYKGTWSNE